MKLGLPVQGPSAGDAKLRNELANWMATSRWNHPSNNQKGQTEKTDWAVSLGAGGVAQGMSPAKYSFDVNAAPNCTSDYAVYPVNASTGNTRANVVGTFSTTVGFTGSGTVALTVTPTVGTATTLTLTASTTLNTGLNFQVFATGSVANATTSATNLAAAINRNLSTTGLNELAAVSATNTVTVYTLTPGNRVVLTDAEGVNNFAFAAVTPGTNGSQANIVGFNQLYSGTGTPLCSGLTFPEFTFSYASGVGPVATSPTLSLNGSKFAFVENDPNLGAIFHVMTLGSGTEYGTCSNTGTALPTCALHPVIPGSTAASTASDYMVPLGLISTGIDSYSSPFVNYSNDTGYVGDANGILYSISGVFLGTPAKSGGNFPVTVDATFALSSAVVDVGGTGNIFVGDGDGYIYNYSSAGVLQGTKLLVGAGAASTTAGGVRDAVVLDSTNLVGYAVRGCNATDSELMQFSYTATTLATKSAATLSTEGCNGPAPLYAPTLDNDYFALGINSGHVLVCEPHTTSIRLSQFSFTTGTMGTTAQFDDSFLASGGAYECSSPTELYSKDVSYTPSAVTQAGNTVTVTTPTNLFVNGQVVNIAGVAAGTGGCTSLAVSHINAEANPITVISATQFSFYSPISTTITGGSCTLTGATATGPTQDYVFFGTNFTTPEAYTFTLPLTSATQTATATNTTSVTGGTSGMVVDNDSASGQAASIYFGTLSTSATQCGTTAAYCAVKLTQAALQ